MALDPIRAKPDITTPFDDEKLLRSAPLLKPYRGTASLSTTARGGFTAEQEHVDPEATARSAVPTKEDISTKLGNLRNLVPLGTVILPDSTREDTPKYIGNLLYGVNQPDAIVIPTNVDEVKAVINFARNNNLHLTVKNGTHPYSGDCLDLTGIVLDMKSFRRVTLDLDGDVKKVTIQGGCTWGDVYEHFYGDNSKYVVLGGRSRSVGVSSFALDGGLSPFSRRYGLPIDSVTEMKLVTAAGSYITVSNMDRDPALFWALRGGGNKNLGVLIEFTTKIHELPNGTVVSGSLTWEIPRDQAEFDDIMDKFNVTDWPNELTMDVVWRCKDESDTDKNPAILAQQMFTYIGTEKDFRETIKPLGEFKDPIEVTSIKWYDWAPVEGDGPHTPIFHDHISFVFGKRHFNPHTIGSIGKFLKVTHDRREGYQKPSAILHHTGGQITQAKPKDTAFFWKESSYVLIFAIRWTDASILDTVVGKFKTDREAFMADVQQGIPAQVGCINYTISDWKAGYHKDGRKVKEGGVVGWGASQLSSVEKGTSGGRAAPSGGDPQGALNRTRDIWNQHSLPNPEKLWELRDASEADVLDVFRKQRMQH